MWRSESGKGMVGGIITLALLGVVAFVVTQFYAPYKDYMVAQDTLKKAAQTCVTISGNDQTCKEWFDRTMLEHGLEFPKANDVQWMREDANKIEIGFAYDEDVDLKVYKRTLKFRFHCMATPAGCINDAS